jgi:Tol biopolymer transport system component/serine/threonine protein kinase
MAVAAGSKLGPYEVLSLVGAGGMGEVYRARDTRLRRDVAIKVLRPGPQADEAHRRRFVQEARTASALNHPNIATIHDLVSVDGTDFIVMEYVAGRPLSDIVRSGMSVDEAVRVAIPIANALARAHEAGVIHRDLKPANVVVATDGTVKVLDFGLAKLVEAPASARVIGDDAAGGYDTRGSFDTASEPTISALFDPASSIGASSIGASSIGGGTPGYMSPEQATGGKVDARSDIFSFGAMLYEMVTGRRAFHGQSVAETLTKVVWEQPTAVGALVPDVPPALDRLIVRCLRKAPERRFQGMADVKVDLQDIKEEREAARAIPAQPISPAPPRVSRPRARLRWLVAATGLALTVALATIGLFLWRPGDATLPAARLVPLTTLRGTEATPAFSPDGRQIAFAWDGDRRAAGEPPNFDIWLKLIGASEARRLTTDPADDMGPSWSPDGRYIAFHRGRLGASASIYLMSSLGGAERKLSDLPASGSETTWFRGAAVPQLAWSPDGRWLAVARARAPYETSDTAGGIHLIPIDGGEARPITAPKAPGLDRDPAFAPDGQRLAYASCEGPAFAPCDVHIVDLDADFKPASAPRRLTRQDRSILGVAWTRDGRSLVYGGARYDWAHLWRVDADGARPPERIEIARQGLSPAIGPAQHRLAFAQSVADTDIHVFEAGRPDMVVVSSSLTDHGPTFSPDGRRIAFESGRSGESEEIWLANADGTNPVQLTHGPGVWQGSPSWSPDGRRIVFDSRGENGYSDLYTIEVDGSGLRRITSGALNEVLPTWSRDGHSIYYKEERPDGSDIWRLPVAGGPAERVTFNGGLRAVESTDGRSLLFVPRDDESPLFSQLVGGGPARQIVDCILSRSLTTGPDGVYYVGCPAGVPEGPLYRLDTVSGVSRRLGIVKTGGSFVPGMAVSPDAKRVLFSAMTSNGGDLLMIENFR